jgi:hypothetical protein
MPDERLAVFRFLSFLFVCIRVHSWINLFAARNDSHAAANADILPTMRSLLKTNRTALALCFNGVVLLMILLAIMARDGRGFGTSAAFGQVQLPPPSAGNGSIVVMPGQLSPNTWGCYVMDSQNQTLCVYQFSPGEKELRLAAARDVQYDRKLGFFNTTPSPTDIRKLVERQEEPPRAAPTTERSPEAAPQ